MIESGPGRWSVVCVVAGKATRLGGRDLVRSVERTASEAGVPVVVFAGNAHPETILGLANVDAARVLIQGIDEHGLVRAVREVAVRPVLEYLGARVRRALASRPVLASALARMVEQIPPTEPTAVERRSRGETVFRRKVRELPELVGTSGSYLERAAQEAGISLGIFVRRNTVLHGMALYERGRSAAVGHRLGYTTGEGWRMLVRRSLKGAIEAPRRRGRRQILRAATRRPIGWHAERVLQALDG